MKKFILKFCFFVLGTLIFLLILNAVIPYNKDGYNRAFFSKRIALQDPQRSSAVVLAGGSNTAFGFNTELITDSIDMPVLNNGLHAGLGLKFIIDNLTPYLIQGDILIISPEYNHFYGDEAYGAQPMTDLFYLEPQLAYSFNNQQIKTVLINTPAYLKSKLEYFLVSVLYPAYETVYKYSTFNEFGDVVGHWNMPSKEYIQISSSKTGALNYDFLNYYKDKLNQLAEKGVKVLIVPPALSESSYEVIKDEVKELQSELEKLDIYFTISPGETILADTLFFDTPYHLNYEGANIRSNQIIQLLQSVN